MKKLANAGLMFLVAVTIFIIAGCSNASKYNWKTAKSYENKLISVTTEQDSFSVREVFDFNFDRAYVIQESYIDGEAFAKKYGLDIDIKEVPENYHEVNRRIVFVDEIGQFVYEFRFVDGENMTIFNEGIVIYPDTKVKVLDSSSQGKDYIVIEFEVKDVDYLTQ